MPSETPSARALLPLSDFSGPLSARVYGALKQAIFSLEYRPGEILRKGEVCELLGVSRSPVSEAVAKLADEGLVAVVPQAGTFISRFSMDEIREGAFTREALELAAVERVAVTITDDQLAQLRVNLEWQQALAGQDDSPGFFKADRQMHAMILSFTGYSRLARLADHSWVQVDRARIMHLPLLGRVHETIAEHRQIIAALQAHDPQKAREVTRHHLSQLIKYLEPMEREHPDLFEPKRT